MSSDARTRYALAAGPAPTPSVHVCPVGRWRIHQGSRSRGTAGRGRTETRTSPASLLGWDSRKGPEANTNGSRTVSVHCPPFPSPFRFSVYPPLSLPSRPCRRAAAPLLRSHPLTSHNRSARCRPTPGRRQADRVRAFSGRPGRRRAAGRPAGRPAGRALLSSRHDPRPCPPLATLARAAPRQLPQQQGANPNFAQKMQRIVPCGQQNETEMRSHKTCTLCRLKITPGVAKSLNTMSICNSKCSV